MSGSSGKKRAYNQASARPEGGHGKSTAMRNYYRKGTIMAVGLTILYIVALAAATGLDRDEQPLAAVIWGFVGSSMIAVLLTMFCLTIFQIHRRSLFYRQLFICCVVFMSAISGIWITGDNKFIWLYAIGSFCSGAGVIVSDIFPGEIVRNGGER